DAKMSAARAFNIREPVRNSLKKTIPETQKRHLLGWLSRCKIVVNIDTHRSVVGVTGVTFRSAWKNFKAITGCWREIDWPFRPRIAHSAADIRTPRSCETLVHRRWSQCDDD